MAEHAMGDWLSEIRGSRPWTEDEGRRVIEAWSASGLSVAAFAREGGLKEDRVYYWRNRFPAAAAKSSGAVAPEDEPAAPAFLPVVARPVSVAQRAGASAPVTVIVRDRLKVEVAALDDASAEWVAALVRSLGEVAS